MLAALADAGLAIVQRWTSARIGEGLIYDLRVALFAKVQRMPIAFFTRTQTGSLTSRLNNDVIGAQNAVTSTLGSVVSNVIVLVTTLAAMFALEWRLTLLTLVVLPMFIIPARRVGGRLQAIAREQMGDNAAMNTQMTERFNVSGATLVKLFGSGDRERLAFARRAAGCATPGSARRCSVGSSSSPSASSPRSGRRRSTASAGFMVVNGNIEIGTLVALAAFTRVYQPLTGLTNARVDLMTSLVSFERVFEVLDAPEAIPERPGAVDLVEPQGAVEFDDVVFRYPPAASRDRVDRAERRSRQRHRSRRRRAQGPHAASRARRDGRPRRCFGRREVDDDLAAPPALRRDRGRCASTATTCATSRSTRCARRSAW